MHVYSYDVLLQRDEIVRKFRTGEIWVLISTDLFARGMDFKGVKCVVNYDFPIRYADRMKLHLFLFVTLLTHLLIHHLSNKRS